MIYYMDSEVFAKLFLDYEYDSVILKAQYVVVSSRIRRKSSEKEGTWSNITIQSMALFPNAEVLASIDSDAMRMAYYEQLDDYKGFLAYLVNAVAKDPKINIIFLATKNENKRFGHLQIIAQYIRDNFKFPVYNYELYVYDECDIEDYDRDKVIKITKKVVDEINESKRQSLVVNGNRRKLMSEYERMTKKDLKKLLKKNDLYEDDMSRKEMLETCELFLT